MQLELALKEGLRQGLPVTDDDKLLFERGVQRLAAIEGMQERRQNIKVLVCVCVCVCVCVWCVCVVCVCLWCVWCV
jgi:hypothetical protein